MSKKPNLFYSTVKHTGTLYFLPAFEIAFNVHHLHCYDTRAIDLAQSAEQFYTTHRDPYRVAASWVNREQFDPNNWIAQWTIYARLLELWPTVFSVGGGRHQHGYWFGETKRNSYGDKHGMHQALDRGDLDYYHQRVPKELIDFAIAKSSLLTDPPSPHHQLHLTAKSNAVPQD